MLEICNLTISDYQSTWLAMKQYVQRIEKQDQIWLLEHDPVYTQGVAGKPEHLLHRCDIPVIQSDRGGQITYHGPGQLIAYPLLDIKKRNISIKQLVEYLQSTVMQTLDHFGIHSHIINGTPGVFVQQHKICSIGLRVRKGFCYHGLALNVNMDLTPFSRINPCGHEGLSLCQMKDFVPTIRLESVKTQFGRDFVQQFGYTQAITLTDPEVVNEAL